MGIPSLDHHAGKGGIWGRHVHECVVAPQAPGRENWFVYYVLDFICSPATSHQQLTTQQGKRRPEADGVMTVGLCFLFYCTLN